MAGCIFARAVARTTNPGRCVRPGSCQNRLRLGEDVVAPAAGTAGRRADGCARARVAGNRSPDGAERRAPCRAAKAADRGVTCRARLLGILAALEQILLIAGGIVPPRIDHGLV